MIMLKVTDLKVHYGGIEALKGISFDVRQGQIVTLIGANGAGKSTTLRAISGLVKPSEGSINFMGRDITSLNSQKIVAEGIALVPEGRRVFANLTVNNLSTNLFGLVSHFGVFRHLSEHDFLFLGNNFSRNFFAFEVCRFCSSDLHCNIFAECFEVVCLSDEVRFAVDFDEDADTAVAMDVRIN